MTRPATPARDLRLRPGRAAHELPPRSRRPAGIAETGATRHRRPAATCNCESGVRGGRGRSVVRDTRSAGGARGRAHRRAVARRSAS
eukprot:3728123-Prymnesium_polylepis.1